MSIDKKIIAFDMDGTLAESKQHLEKDMAALLFTLTRNVRVAIISGGSFDQFEKQFLPFFSDEQKDELFYKNIIILPTSGSQRYEYDQTLKEWTMTDSEGFQDIIKKEVLMCLSEIIDSGTYGIHPLVSGDYVIEDRKTQITMSALGQHAPLDAKKEWDPHQVKRQEMKKILESKISGISVIIGGTTSLDILPLGFDKAKGLHRLLNKLSLLPSDMLFLGDALFPGGNDYSVKESGIESIQVSGPQETAQHITSWLH